LTLGAKGTDQEVAATIDYLTRAFPAEEMPKLNVNTAGPIDFESRFTFKRSEAAAIVKYREKNGPFQSVDDFKKIPGIDASKIVSKKDRITF
ncbi:MAG: helix-hairpin-helix domain-containing protein, partial [Acidobacteriota bacterium]|nr:helix-hairpin-helix domain-containing protein [Acidobacteriota bacterium]